MTPERGGGIPSLMLILWMVELGFRAMVRFVDVFVGLAFHKGKGREGKGRKGKGRVGKERKGKGRKGKGREGKGRESCVIMGKFIF